MKFPEIMLVDFLYFLLIFCAFYFTVATIRFFAAVISDRLKPNKVKNTHKSRRKKQPAAVRSIEINPDEIDKIYVKKIS